MQGVEVDAEVRLGAARVRVAQRYRHTENRPVEAFYVFPLPEGSAVCGFEARVGDRRITGSVEECEQAFERYDDAMMEGDGAFLLEQERPDIFTASVGNLSPGAEVVLVRSGATRQPSLSVTEAVVATVAVLITLQREAAGRRDEWRRAATKAERWLEAEDAPRAEIEARLGEGGS